MKMASILTVRSSGQGMEKTYKVRWSYQSVRQTDAIVTYLKDNWTKKEILRFLRALKNFENLVSKYPEIYPESQFKAGFHKAVILKQVSIIYSFANDIIKIHIIFDNRQNPQKIKKKYF
jgi:plasmid stabilization system protein ParE